MKNRSFMRIVLLSAAVVAGLGAWATSATLPIALAAASSASAAASAAFAGPPERKPLPEVLSEAKIPDSPSPTPTFDEWKTATEVMIERPSYETKDCKILRVREWLKIKCEIGVGAIHQHSGNVQGVSFWITPKADLMNFSEYNSGELIMPLRRGDRRVIQFFKLGHDACIGIGFEPSVIVDESWLEGETSPTVVLR